MTDNQYRIEIEEAMAAADDALFYLQKANDSMKSAKNWGLWDMFGGGLISTFVKHGCYKKHKQNLYKFGWLERETTNCIE